MLRNASARLGAVEKKIQELQVLQESHEREQTGVAALARKETALSAGERETYSGFLKEDFFTKKDFSRLEQFYEKTWDRLSESGKNQMSHRIWGRYSPRRIYLRSIAAESAGEGDGAGL